VYLRAKNELCLSRLSKALQPGRQAQKDRCDQSAKRNSSAALAGRQIAKMNPVKQKRHSDVLSKIDI